ncbi:MAG: transposase OrfA [Puniceicoccaceae bacterium 5H]|nr:MAG: transposase OrfA [Puniceicoccaceae bacterium 5H]
MREFLTAIAYLVREGCSWRGLPPQFGHWHNVYVRFRRWEKAKTWGLLWLKLQGSEAAQARAIFVDSTVIKAHPHAAGAPKKTVAIRLWDALEVG